MEGFGELFEEGLEVAVLGVLLFEAFALPFGLGLGGFARALRGGLGGVEKCGGRSQALAHDTLEFHGVAIRVEIAEIQLDTCFARRLFDHFPQEIEFLVLVLFHPQLVLAGPQLLDDSFQAFDFLLAETHGIGQQIGRFSAQQVAEPAAALGR